MNTIIAIEVLAIAKLPLFKLLYMPSNLTLFMALSRVNNYV